MVSSSRLSRLGAARKATVLLCVLLAAEGGLAFWIVSSGRALTENLIENPSGEAVDSLGIPACWGFYRSHGNGQWGPSDKAASGKRGVFIRPTAYDRRRSNLLNIGLLPIASDGYRGDGALELEPNASYSLSFSARGTVPNVRVGLLAWETPESGSEMQRRVISPTVENVFRRWTKYKLTFETPANLRQAAPFFQLKGSKESFPEGSVLFLDDVDFRQQAVPLAQRLLHADTPVRDPECAVSPIGALTWLRILAIAIGLSVLPALLIPIPNLGLLDRLLLGWAALFPILAVLSLLSHYLSVSGFTLTWIALIAFAFLLSFRGRSHKFGFANLNQSPFEILCDCAIVVFPGIVLCYFAYSSGAGWLLYYGADMGDYLGRARMVLGSGQFLPVEMGSPYGDHTVSAISTTIQVWHALVAYLSGCDLVYVSLVLSTAMAFVLVAVFYFLLRSAGIGRSLAVVGIPLLFLCFPLLSDYRRYAHNRAVAYLVGLIAVACLLRAFQKRGFPSGLAFLSCCLFGSLAAIHIPRAGAVFYVFVVLAAVLGITVDHQRVHALVRARRCSSAVALIVGMAGVISLLFLAPKTESVLNLFLNPLQIAHMPFHYPVRFSGYPHWWMGVVFLCGLGLIFVAKNNDGQLRFRGGLIIALALSLSGVALVHYLYPFAHARNYREPIRFVKPLLLTLPLLFSLEIIFARERRNRWAVILSLVLIGVVLKPLYTEVRSTVGIQRRQAASINKLNQRRYVRDHTDILEYLEATHYDSWPRVGGDPSQTQTLTTIANVRPASWRLRLPLKTQLFDFGNVPIMESCHLLNAIDEMEAAIWCKRLKVDYVLDDFGEVQWGARPDRFWQTPDSRALCVVDSPSNRLFLPPPAPPGHTWDWYESRVFRFRVELADLKGDRSPLLLGVSCGAEVLPLENQREWRKSFVYTFHGRNNHKNWGEMETTQAGLVGRRVFDDYAIIKRTKGLRSAPFRVSFDGVPGRVLELKFWDDRACTMYLELWTGKDWLTLSRRRFAGNGSVTEFAVELPEINCTHAARFFPRLVAMCGAGKDGRQSVQLLDAAGPRLDAAADSEPGCQREFDLHPDQWQVWRARRFQLDELQSGGLRLRWGEAKGGYVWFLLRENTPTYRVPAAPGTFLNFVADVAMSEGVAGEAGRLLVKSGDRG